MLENYAVASQVRDVCYVLIYVLCAYLDVEGAFDSTSYDSINIDSRRKHIDDNIECGALFVGSKMKSGYSARFSGPKLMLSLPTKYAAMHNRSKVVAVIHGDSAILILNLILRNVLFGVA